MDETFAEPGSTIDAEPLRYVLKWQAWRAAILSGLGALLGILLAFGIDAWWGYFSDLQREAAYLNALHSELLETRETLTDTSDPAPRPLRS